MVAYTRQVLDTTATHQYDTMLLKVVTLTGDVGIHLLAVGQTYTSHLTHSRVWLLRGGCVNADTNATTLWA